jgi:GxxExxY protein
LNKANHQDTKVTTMHQEIPEDLNDLAKLVVDASFKVHKALGAGLLESAYQAWLEIELQMRGVRFLSQYLLPICYEGVLIQDAYRIDLLDGELLVVELKSVDQLLSINSAQLLT